MKKIVRCLLLTVALGALMIPATVSAQDTTAQNDGRLRIDLSGFNEVIGPTLGAGTLFSTGSGRLTLKINKQVREVAYELTYAFPDAAATPLVGLQFVNQAHLHVGQRHTTGAIYVWLCQSADSPAPVVNTPICPSPSGTVSGSITPSMVLPVPAQGFPGDEAGFDALLAAMGSGAIYANVHTDRFPAGEIRGQVGHRNDR